MPDGLKESPVAVRIRQVRAHPYDSSHPMEQKQTGPKVIAFANQKGGVAKTTTTLNLAVAFAEKGHRVLCVDMDPQGNLTMSQGIDPDTLERVDVRRARAPAPRSARSSASARSTRLRVDRPRRRRDRDVDA